MNEEDTQTPPPRLNHEPEPIMAIGHKDETNIVQPMCPGQR